MSSRGGRTFSWSEGGDGGGTTCMRLGGGPGGGETTTGDRVRDKGGCSEGVRTWYDGEMERGPKMYSDGTSSSGGWVTSRGSGYWSSGVTERGAVMATWERVSRDETGEARRVRLLLTGNDRALLIGEGVRGSGDSVRVGNIRLHRVTHVLMVLLAVGAKGSSSSR
jgi:hypothetical protein